MIFLLCLIITANLIATEDYPAIMITSPNSPKLENRKNTGTIIHLLHIRRLIKKDFETSPEIIKKEIGNRYKHFSKFKHDLEQNRCDEETKEKYKIYLKWFYSHHGNLMIWTVNKAVENDNSANYLDLFQELIQIPYLKGKKLIWQEVGQQGRIYEIIGTIADYIALYKSQISDDPCLQENIVILDKCLDYLKPETANSFNEIIG